MILENESWKDARGRTPLHYASFATVAIADERADQGEADPYGDGATARRRRAEVLSSRATVSFARRERRPLCPRAGGAGGGRERWGGGGLRGVRRGRLQPHELVIHSE